MAGIKLTNLNYNLDGPQDKAVKGGKSPAGFFTGPTRSAQNFVKPNPEVTEFIKNNPKTETFYDMFDTPEALQAQEDIPKGRVLAYYRTKSVPYTNKCFNYQVENTPGRSWILDVEQFGLVKRGIPYVAAFSNEPSETQKKNCEMWGVEKPPKRGYRGIQGRTS